MNFAEAVRGLIAGDFSRLAPLFETPAEGSLCPIITQSFMPRGMTNGESCSQILKSLMKPLLGFRTPLAWARKKGHVEIAADLLQTGAQEGSTK